MKKLFALALAVIMVTSTTTVAFAAESTTTLTATVPAATYTLNIPANQEIPFGTTQADIGNITVTDATGFAVGKNLEVTISYDAFKADGVSTTIPYTLSLFASSSSSNIYDATKAINSGSVVTFAGKTNGTVEEKLELDTVYMQGGSTTPKLPVSSIRFKALSEDWGKALAGEYTSTITFTAEVVVEG